MIIFITFVFQHLNISPCFCSINDVIVFTPLMISIHVFTRDGRGGIFFTGRGRARPKICWAINSTWGLFGNYSRGVVFSRGCITAPRLKVPPQLLALVVLLFHYGFPKMEKFKSVTSFLPRGFDHFCRAEPLGYFTGLAWAGSSPLPKWRVPCRAGRQSLVLQQYY